ncbi:MAG: N-6 DNA methylase [Verrucomicrobia bacterium]|nr:N-6 DNA methylase [Verrucomicrobiota bacterium]
MIGSKVRLTDNREAALAAFAHPPCDSRSACVVAIDGLADPLQDAVTCRPLGAPVVFVCFQNHLEWWIQGTTKTERRESIPASDLDQFFDKHRSEFGPDAIYRAKNWGRFDRTYQLEFVDMGLMPVVEAEAGRKLASLVENAVIGTKARLGWREVSGAQGRWLLQANFWLVAAKILQDKAVSVFGKLDLTNLETVYARLADHYGAPAPVEVGSRRQAEALRESAQEIARFGHLGLVSTEALAHLYEHALITKETRAELGTHSTPTYLVDYIVGKLRPWIERTPFDQHYVFEPACGHAAFLLAAMRVLGEFLPAHLAIPSARHQYLRDRLHGCDVDPFALEIARLSLTLADVPNPNGWDLKEASMFGGDFLERHAAKASIVLANPPFEDLASQERALLTQAGAECQHVNKAAEMLRRVTARMQPGSVFGVVLPQGILHSQDAKPLREFLVAEFEISEVCLFPDKVFTFSDAESAVLLGRRLHANEKPRRSVLYRRVREADVERFKRAYDVTNDYQINQARFSANEERSFFVPDLQEVWSHCELYPKLENIAEIGQGLIFRSQSDPEYPRGAITESDHRLKGLVEGFARLRETLRTHELPDVGWLNLDPAVIRRPVHGTAIGLPKVLLNYARVSRGPWRLKAFIDREGHPVTSRFLVVRPHDRAWPLEVVWALCNSPFANAYSYAFSGKRDVLAGLMRAMPVPRADASQLTALVETVRKYLKEARAADESVLASPAAQERLRVLHWRVDAEVLRLYALPRHLERQLLDLFGGVERRGVPFEQKEYLPRSFAQPLALCELLAITADWEQTNERRELLILNEEHGKPSPEERAELADLQRLADARIDLIAPLPLQELEAVAADLKRKGLWAGL